MKKRSVLPSSELSRNEINIDCLGKLGGLFRIYNALYKQKHPSLEGRNLALNTVGIFFFFF